jgi:3-deoxy-manno-octulosonate cytidylyltransferase (CMP-KDO synthetase)
MKSKILAVIPARLGSGRFPGKVLAPIGDRSLLQRLYEEVSRSKLIGRLIVATDSDEVCDRVISFGGEVIKTSRRHRTGSDRVAEVMDKIGGNIIINIQADHLGISGRFYDRILSGMLKDKKIETATIAARVESEAIAINGDSEALWFSRYPIPFLQGINGNRLNSYDYYYHVGVYFFRRDILRKFAGWRRSKIEKAESLEQLRLLEHGCKIKIYKTGSRVLSLDAPEDLKAAGKYLKYK